MSSGQTRRAFVLTTGAAAVSAGSLRGGEVLVRLGGPVFLKSDDPGELAREHRRLGYSAAYCPEAHVADRARIAAIEKAFAENDVVIAEVGAWKNLLDPDAERRRQNLAYVSERCALADAVGALCCVDIAGSYNPGVWYGPYPKNLSKEFFDATVENCRKVIDAVKPARTKFAVEMMGWSLPDGPDSYLELIRAVDRPAFAVHMDICNGINCPRRFYENSAFIHECFAKLGRWVVSCHAKDLSWITEMNVHFQEVVPGRGQVDLGQYLREIGALGRGVPLMLEHLTTPEEYDEGARHIRRVASQIGVTLA
ncbi:MAG: sugar phosphate isomerase/epimerase [Bryobacteraceae bacterium]|jgi:sugar phosphate isomerase/epimerase